ncbi:hypothetical protein NYR68_00555 [Actinobacillus equuli subsp. haemolyticus]|uniref:hypothetical protein n=1 Tax=Actinobacillus equuli TaxID=718 RepID=UPI00244665C1|nr:hypothetical protein [Actinobacillus equuli]WGE50914.1 hypothetical protein NYR68_00555 [Actinobacillus equuli subsp. haemolyticus]
MKFKMKNLLAVLGVSFLLAGCFDDAKKQDADSSQMPVEQKQPQTGVKSEEKSSEQRSGEDKTSSEKNDKSDKTADVDKKKEDKAELVKTNKAAESHKFIEKHHKSEKSVTKKSFVAVSHEKKAENKTKRSVAKSKSAKRRQNINGTYENGKLVSNFSPEELRVGAQVPMSDNEIRQQKMQCRYPFMSQQEVAENNCGVKTVTISY